MLLSGCLILIKLPYPPEFQPEKITSPGAAAKTGVPIGAAISIPLCNLPLRQPYPEVSVPFAGQLYPLKTVGKYSSEDGKGGSCGLIIAAVVVFCMLSGTAGW